MGPVKVYINLLPTSPPQYPLHKATPRTPTMPPFLELSRGIGTPPRAGFETKIDTMLAPSQWESITAPFLLTTHRFSPHLWGSTYRYSSSRSMEGLRNELSVLRNSKTILREASASHPQIHSLHLVIGAFKWGCHV